ncbi:pentapeptide repeat-containing protein [Amycolatopsis pigmentata]|uniref:Pentapeptide repeat-containing protein n=1 Tax=Amycolatopsis pigmentata TaxID=450801 RepID=A0ABW5FVN0_9PSEU
MRLKSPLAVTFVLAVGLLVAVSGWLLADPMTSRADALRTGGLAAGGVVALYALWLNDRRRQVEERRQKVESDRLELELVRAARDRARITEERFAKSVELLGHDADQVRVGALHALAGLAHNHSEYTQTVLDVLCSYLRRPFDNPHLSESEKTDPVAERELQVRLTAQRLVVQLLPPAGSGGKTFDLDLTGASLEYFDLSGRAIGTLIMRYAVLLSSTNFSDCEFRGPAWFTATTFGKGRLRGRFRCQDSTFDERAWFSGTEFGGIAEFDRSTFRGEASFKKAHFAADAILRDAVFLSTLELHSTRFDALAELRISGAPKAVALYNTLVRTDRARVPGFWTLLPHAEGVSRVAHAAD